MKNQPKQFIIMLAALAVLVGGFFLLRAYNDRQAEAEEETENDTIVIVDGDSDDVTGLSYVYDGVTYTFEKEDDTWYYADDHSVNLTQATINTMISRALPLEAEQVITDVTDYDQYGLADPERSITLTTADAVYTYYIGNANEIMDGNYYLQVDGSDDVLLVDYYIVTNFNKTLDDLIEEEEEEEESTESSESEETESTESGESEETESTEAGESSEAESTESGESSEAESTESGESAESSTAAE